MANQSKKLFIILTSFINILIIMGLPNLVSAEENQIADFGISAILPDNQIDKNISYFDLLVTPGQKQVVEIVLSNASEKEQTFEVYINPAVTSDGGTIDYSQRNPVLDETLPFDVREAIKIEKNEYIVKGKSEIKIPITIVLSNEKFEGRVLAGINVSKKEDNKKETKENDGVSIKNRLSYNLGIVLQESQTTIKPDLKLKDGKAIEINALPHIQLNFQNPMPTIISDLVFTSKIYLDNELYLENTSSPFLIAPNSKFPLNLDLNKTEAKAGNYRAEINAKDGKGNSWKFEYKFSVEKKEAEEVNQNSVLPQQTSNQGIIIILAVGLVLALAFIIILLLKRRKKKEE